MNDKKIRKPNNINSSDWKELLQVLDEMEKRSQVEEVEEVMVNHRKATRQINPPTEDLSENKGTNDPLSLLIVPGGDDEEKSEDITQFASLLLSNQQPAEEAEALPPAPANLRNPFAVLAALILPRKGDAPAALAIKSGVLVAVLALLTAVALLVNNLFILPYANKQLNRELYELYDPDENSVVTGTAQYPEGMLASFKNLYTRNSEVRGWLSFHNSGDNDFLNIEYPVVQTGDNKTYMSVDFDKEDNANGTLFFDKKCRINGVEDTSRVLLLYGNSTGNGQMLSGLTNLMGSVNSVRSATTFTLSTLYEKAEYYVLAVVLLDGDNNDLDYKRTVFADEDDFFDHVQQFRDRSLFDYPTDLRGDDELAIIGTGIPASASHMPDGRLLVVARRQRANETGVDMSGITKNEDVIMPYQWYYNQGRSPHKYYFNDVTTRTTTTTTTEKVTDATEPTGEGAENQEGEENGETPVGPTSEVNKNTYTTSHTYTETYAESTTQTAPTGVVITKIPQ